MRIFTVVKYATPLLLTVGMNASSARAQATRPATKPAMSMSSSTVAAPAVPLTKADTTALDFLTRGLKELESGNNQEAHKLFNDGLAVYGAPQPISVSATDTATHVALNHAVAVANLRLNQLPPAKQAIDKAQAAKWTNDSLIFNTASIATAIKGTAIQAVNMLDTYLAAHPNADESWVNLYGLAIEKAAVDPANRTKLEPKYKSLDAYQARLEQTQPGKHRYGSQWLDDAQWKEMKPKIDATKKNIDQLEKKVADAERRVQQSQQTAARSTAAPSGGGGGGGGGRRQRGGGGGGGGGGNAAAAAQNRAPTGAAAAQQQLTAAKADLAAADRGPDQWESVKLVGMTPEIEMVREEAVAPAPAPTPATRPAARRGA